MDDPQQITLDPASGEMTGVDVPQPVSSFSHVARSTGSQLALVPTAQPFKLFSRRTPHRSTGQE
jgi:hypothetical protein